jgi:hypothetical protein
MNKAHVDTFFSAMLPDDVPMGKRVLIWTLPDKQSFWHTATEGAANECIKQATQKADVYVGAGLASKAYGRKARVPNAEVAGIFGLWADIDFKDSEAHRKGNLPNEEEALEFCLNLPKPTTAIVHSGHGFQCWWAFDQPWLFEDAEQRNYGAAIARAWIYKVRDAARANGWDVDSTIDLARVMRVPGTMNYKVAGKPISTSLVECRPEIRYNWHEFNGIHVDSQSSFSTGTTPPAAYQNGALATFVLSASAEPPATKLIAANDNDPKFKASWNRTRKDMADQSASSYDMSLANLAVLYGWDDQEIVDLLIASRRKHGDDLKLREDYYSRTLFRARNDTTKARETEEAEQVIKDAADGVPIPPEEIRASMSQLFGVPITGLIKYPGDPSTYELRIGHNGTEKSITLGGSEVLTNQRAFIGKLTDGVDVVIPQVKSVEWVNRMNALLKTVEYRDIGTEGTPTGRTRNWIGEYLDRVRVSTEDEWKEAAEMGRPFMRQDYTHVSLTAFRIWIRNTLGEQVSTKELARHLKKLGWEYNAVNLPGGDSRAATTRSTWRIEGKP